jgi:hypothetical protein
MFVVCGPDGVISKRPQVKDSGDRRFVLKKVSKYLQIICIQQTKGGKKNYLLFGQD